MTFISYAQNYEDVMLRRALKNVENGFYIDVGANDPIVDSVTKSFYDMGWRGINIEPVNEWFEKLQQNRPDDINLKLAVGESEGEVNFYEVVGTGLSTMDESIARQHEQESGFDLKRNKVSVARLTTICEQYANSDIHFLKIDVEGGEKSVLDGFDLKKFRPWIILVESTLPGTQIEKYESWEPILLAADYEYIKFDGLNRFYVAKEHKKIKAFLIVPPNVFDGFVLSGTGSSSFHVEIANIRVALQESKTQREQLEIQVQRIQDEAIQRDEKLTEKETKQQELLLSLLEKETRLQEAATKLTERKQEVDELQVSLTESATQQQVLDASLQETETQRQQLETQVQRIQDEAIQRDEKLTEKETKQQELLLSLLEKETRLQEAATKLTERKQEVDELQVSLTESATQQQVLDASLQETETQRQQLETQVQRIQDEAIQRDEELRKKDESNSWLNNEWSAAKQKVEELHQSNHQWWSMADQQSKELEERQAKIDELNHSSHHWWLEAERLTKELQAVYNSKSWRITWPLRKLMQFFKWLLRLPIRLVLWLIRLPKRTVRWLLVKIMSSVINHPALKVRAIIWLHNYPNLKEKLRRFAQARGLIAMQAVSSIIPIQPIPESTELSSSPSVSAIEILDNEADITTNEDAALEQELSHLNPSARRIYREIKTAMAQHEQENL